MIVLQKNIWNNCEAFNISDNDNFSKNPLILGKVVNVGYAFYKYKKKNTIKIKKKHSLEIVHNEDKQKFIIGLKKQYGLLKWKYNDKLYLYKRLNFLNDLKKYRKSYLTKNSLNIPLDPYSFLRKKNINKQFFKKNRNIVNQLYYNNTKWLRQKKTIKLFFLLKKKKKHIYLNKCFDVLLNYNFFSSYTDLLTFYNFFGIYKNNKKTFYNDLILIGDVIRLPFNEFFFYFKKNYFKDITFLLKQVKSKLFFFFRNKRSNKHLKQKTKNSLPKWVFKFKYYQESKFCNFEICYMTLSIIYVKKLVNHNYYNNNYICESFYLNDLYNWKYIV